MSQRWGAVAVVLVAISLTSLSCVSPRVAAGPPLPVRSTDPHASDPGIKREHIMEAILGKKAELGACVKAEHQATGAAGKLLLSWDILPSGEPANIGVRDAEHATLELSHCIARVVGTTRYPATETGATAIVFPFKY